MVLVDTSVWIGFLNRKGARRTEAGAFERVVTCLPVIQEVLQGIGSEHAFRRAAEGMLALPRLGDPVTPDRYLEAVDLFRLGRRRGITIRSATDCLIAAIAIRERVPVAHQDRDFDAIAKLADLRVEKSPI